LKIYKNVLFTLGLGFSIAHASVVIKLGSYGNKSNSERQVLRIQEKLGLKSSVIEEAGIYRLYSLSIKNKDTALPLLEKYKQLFPDAYIMQSTQPYSASKAPVKIDIPIEMVKLEIIKTPKIESQKTLVQTLSKAPKIMTPKSQIKKHTSLNAIIKGHTFYLCPNIIKSNGGKLLIEASFDDKHTVTYRTIVGKMPSLRLNYMTHKERLYFSRSYTFNPAQYNYIKDTLFEYHLVAKHSKGKRLNAMRYYTNYENAKAYLNSLRF